MRDSGFMSMPARGKWRTAPKDGTAARGVEGAQGEPRVQRACLAPRLSRIIRAILRTADRFSRSRPPLPRPASPIRLSSRRHGPDHRRRAICRLARGSRETLGFAPAMRGGPQHRSIAMTFEQLGLAPALLRALADYGYT